MGKASDWLREERRKILGDWAAVCLACGFAQRYFDESEDELPAACPQCGGELRSHCPSLRRALLVGLRGRLRGLRRAAPPARAPRRPDPQARPLMPALPASASAATSALMGYLISEKRMIVTVSARDTSRL